MKRPPAACGGSPKSSPECASRWVSRGPKVGAMRIYLGADHAGFERKNQIKEHLEAAGHEVIDCGAHVYDLSLIHI